MILLAAALLVAACGGGSDEGRGHLRLVNATLDVDRIDLTIDHSDIAETRIVTEVDRDDQSAYVELPEKSYTLRAKRAGFSSTLAVGATAIEKNQHRTAFAYGREGDYRIATVAEDEDLPSSGNAAVRVLNAAPDAGALDVYLTERDATLDNTVPIGSNVVGGGLSFFNTIDAGTYRLRITGALDKTDLRLDVPVLRIEDRARVTLVVQPGRGGVLVDVLVSEHQAGLSAVKNTLSRVRLVASVASGSAVTGSLGTTALNVALRSPSVGQYTRVPAGRQDPDLRVDGVRLATGPVDLLPGADYALAVYADASAPSWVLLPDDNRLPLASDRARIRLVHLASAAGSSLSLTQDYLAVLDSVGFGQASQPVLVNSSAESRLEVASTSSAAPLYLNEEALLVGKGVYSLFMLTGPYAPTGVLRRDR